LSATPPRTPQKKEKTKLDAIPNQKSLQVEIETRLKDQRLTPSYRRIVQCLMDHSNELGFLSSMELAQLANVSQPSVSRFSVALGFDGFLDMRRCFRAISEPASPTPATMSNRYQSAAAAEAANVADLVNTLSDLSTVKAFGEALAKSKPLAVLGLRASSGHATQFCYFAAKVHPDVRPIIYGGSLVEDQLEQAHVAGASLLLAFAMPLYPRETLKALRYAKQLGMKVALVSDPTFRHQSDLVDLLLTVRINSSLVYDSCAALPILISVLLDAMCDAMPQQAEARLEYNERSSSRRKVFAS
jgi:DNA-binding MurR/RpiR family transcriptional regulator